MPKCIAAKAPNNQHSFYKLFHYIKKITESYIMGKDGQSTEQPRLDEHVEETMEKQMHT
jgi:hypothetical protein